MTGSSVLRLLRQPQTPGMLGTACGENSQAVLNQKLGTAPSNPRSNKPQGRLMEPSEGPRS